MISDPWAVPTLWLAWAAQYGRVAGFAYGCLLREQVLNHTALAQQWLGCPNPDALAMPNAGVCGGKDPVPMLGETQPAADGISR